MVDEDNLCMGIKRANNELQDHKSQGHEFPGQQAQASRVAHDGVRECLHHDKIHRGRLFPKNRLEPMSPGPLGERRPEAMPHGIR